MKKVVFFLVASIFVLTFLSGKANAADKFGYVDILRIASEYSKAKDYNKKLEGRKDSYQAEIDKKAEEINQLGDKIKLLSEKEKEAKNKELEDKIKTLEEYRQGKLIDLRKEDFENTKVIVEDIKSAIKQFAEKEGYTLVFDGRALVYDNQNIDITDKILIILNKNYKKQ